jgi:hypothetical protein
VSGGSYDYLCWADDLDRLLEKQHHLEAMADRLAGLGYADDAAQETTDLLLTLRQWRIRAQAHVKRSRGVWKAVEWWDSADWDEDAVREALAKYRGDSEGKEEAP